jgi:hypothetical protein
VSAERDRAAARDTTRAARVVHTKYAADMAAMSRQISDAATDTPRFSWVALREDCLASLAPENLRDPLPPVECLVAH